jgi:hypothetical protein
MMPFSVRPLPEPSVIEIRLSGRVEIEELRSLATEVTLLAEQTGFRHALADCRDYLGGPGLGEIYFLTKEIANRPVGARGVQALVAPSDPRASADVQFYVETAHAYGTRARMFATRDAAIEWLREVGPVTRLP